MDGFVLAATGAALLVAAGSARADFAVSVRTVHLRNDPHVVLVVGEYRCDPMDPPAVTGAIDLTVARGEGDERVNGFGFLFPRRCDGRRKHWRAEVTTFGAAPYGRGPAELLTSGYACNAENECVTLGAATEPLRINR